MRTEDNPQTKASNPKDLLAEGEKRVLLHLIPSTAQIHVALAFMDGARKYGPYNWREKGVGAGTYISAAKRHIADWLDGEENAGDSGVHHLGHAVACLMILMDAQAVENLVDDRPLPAPTAEMMETVRIGGCFHETPPPEPRCDCSGQENALESTHSPDCIWFRSLNGSYLR